ncbi:MAG: sugar nucleotide-binding protein [Geminicoccaceae bacterium]
MKNDCSSILVIGAGGLIGQALVSCGLRGSPHDILRGDGVPDDVRTIIHAGRDPRLGREDYEIDEDIENIAAGIAAERGLDYLMLSSRKVYGEAPSPIAEEAPPRPNDAYGRQKRAMEMRLLEKLGSRLTILRIANVFSFEPGRRSFFGIMLDRLRERDEILFDMSPETARDFIPLHTAAGIIASLALSPPGGIVNIGSGIPLPTGDLARALIAGHGSGRLACSDYTIRDAFVLDVARMYALTGIRLTREQLLASARDIGAALHTDRERPALS